MSIRVFDGSARIAGFMRGGYLNWCPISPSHYLQPPGESESNRIDTFWVWSRQRYRWIIVTKVFLGNLLWIMRSALREFEKIMKDLALLRVRILKIISIKNRWEGRQGMKQSSIRIHNWCSHSIFCFGAIIKSQWKDNRQTSTMATYLCIRGCGRNYGSI